MEILIQHLDKVVNRLQVGQIVIPDIDADAKVQASIASIDDLEAAKLQTQTSLCENSGQSKKVAAIDNPPQKIMARSKIGLYLHEICVFGIANRHQCVHLLDQLLLLVIVEMHVPFGEPCLPCTVLN